jgi:flagellar basal-body rod protein FlgB
LADVWFRRSRTIGTERDGWRHPLSTISDSSVIDNLRRQMTIAVAKQVASAGNLANIDTPGYKAKEVTFSDALKSKLAPAASTNSTFPSVRQATASPIELSEKEVEGLPARRDGNTVQLDRELLSMGRAAGDFAAAQTALAAKFRLVRYAINEGK